MKTSKSEEPDRELSVAEVAVLVKKPERTIYNWLAIGIRGAGTLPHDRIGGAIRISEHQLCLWLLSCNEHGKRNYQKDLETVREQSRKLQG